MCQWGGGREPLLTFVRAGFLESWRQMTDGSVSSASREWEVRRGGGKPAIMGRSRRERAPVEGKQNQENFSFRMGQKDV